MTALFAAVGVGLVLLLLTREISPAFTRVLQIALTVLCVLTVLPSLQALLAFAGETAAGAGLGDWCAPLLRMLGIGILAGFLSEGARELGANALATGIELAGRVVLLTLSLPLLRALVSLIGAE